jgi:hypothetical protein
VGTPARQRRWFEFGVAVTILAICAWALLERLHYVQEVAEMTAVESTVRNIASGLRLAQVQRLAANPPQPLEPLLAGDPFDGLALPLPHRRVEVLCGADHAPGEFAYRPLLQVHLHTADGSTCLRWRVLAVRDAANRIEWLKLENSPPFTWF